MAGGAASATACGGPVAAQLSSLVRTPVSHSPQKPWGCGQGPPSSGPPPGSAVGELWSTVRAPRPPPPSDVWPVDGHAGDWDEEGWHAAPPTRRPRPAPAADTAAAQGPVAWVSGPGPCPAWTGTPLSLCHGRGLPQPGHHGGGSSPHLWSPHYFI